MMMISYTGYTNTTLKLNIIELPSKPDEELEMWKKDIDDDVQDMEEENEETYEREMASYRAKLRKWKTKHHHEKNKEEEEEGDDEELSDASIRKPKPPQKNDILNLRKQIE